MPTCLRKVGEFEVEEVASIAKWNCLCFRWLEKIFPKWWFNGDLPQNHLKQTKVHQSKIPPTLWLFLNFLTGWNGQNLYHDLKILTPQTEKGSFAYYPCEPPKFEVYTPKNEHVPPKKGPFQNGKNHLPTLDFRRTYVSFRGSRRLSHWLCDLNLPQFSTFESSLPLGELATPGVDPSVTSWRLGFAMSRAPGSLFIL